MIFWPCHIWPSDFLFLSHIVIITLWPCDLLRLWTFVLKTFLPDDFFSSFWNFDLLALWPFGIVAFWHCDLLSLWLFPILTFWHFHCLCKLLVSWPFSLVTFWWLCTITSDQWAHHQRPVTFKPLIYPQVTPWLYLPTEPIVPKIRNLSSSKMMLPDVTGFNCKPWLHSSLLIFIINIFITYISIIINF